MSLNLLNYFIHDRRDQSPAYVRKCEKFLTIKKKDAAALFKLQASSGKLQAGRLKKDTIMN